MQPYKIYNFGHILNDLRRNNNNNKCDRTKKKQIIDDYGLSAYVYKIRFFSPYDFVVFFLRPANNLGTMRVKVIIFICHKTKRTKNMEV